MRRLLMGVALSLTGMMNAPAAAGVLPCSGEKIVKVAEFASFQRGAGQIDLGYKFAGCNAVSWVAYQSGVRHRVLSDADALKLVQHDGGTALPAPPSVKAAMLINPRAFWREWLAAAAGLILVLTGGMAGLLSLRRARLRRASSSVAPDADAAVAAWAASAARIDGASLETDIQPIVERLAAVEAEAADLAGIAPDPGQTDRLMTKTDDAATQSAAAPLSQTAPLPAVKAIPVYVSPRRSKVSSAQPPHEDRLAHRLKAVTSPRHGEAANAA